MKKMGFAIVLILAAAALLYFILRPAGRIPTAAGEKPVVRFGVSLNLSGDMPRRGQAVRKAMTLALDEINANPENIFDYDLVFEDDAMSPAQAAVNASKLISHDRVNVLFTFLQGPAYAVNPIAEEAKTVAFHGSYDPRLSAGEYNFQNMVSAGELNMEIGRFAQRKGVKKAVLLFQAGDGQREAAALLKGQLEKAGIEVSESFYGGENGDFEKTAAAVKEMLPDMVVLSGAGRGLELAAEALAAQGVGGVKAGIDIINFAENPEVFDGFYSIGARQGDQAFRDKMENDFTFYSAYYYDDMHILHGIFERLGAQNGRVVPAADEIAAELLKEKGFDGAAGKASLTESGQFYSGAAVYKFKNGRLTEENQ